ncbi:Uncharacterized protein Adt_31636 [Abeliophyllum distichum]|uniref:Two-component response regulator n=1 Tax=Abeliophyllum distichum TaxID=126358 RepID=A0ABD1REN9_9LAMI
MDIREDILDGKSMERKGICILVVNDDFTCCNIVAEMLEHCTHEVLHTGRISDALEMLWDRKDRLELVLTNAHRLESDEFDIIQCIQDRFNLPTILMSPDKMKIASNGQEFIVAAYIVDSLSRNDINNLWQSALEKVKANKVVDELEGNFQERSMAYNVFEADNNSPSMSEPTRVQHKRKREEDISISEQHEGGKDESNNKKKPRMMWTREMHQKFLEAIEILGPENAVPKKIVEIMNVPGLTRENVASHLQAGYTKPFEQGSYLFNAKGYTSTLNLRQSQLLSTNNERNNLNTQKILSFGTVPERNNYTNLGIPQYRIQNGPEHLQLKYTSSGQDYKTYGEINRGNSSTDTNLSKNSNSTDEYVGLRLSNDGKSVEYGHRNVSVDNVISRETLVPDSGTTEEEFNFNWLGTSTSYIQPKMISFSSPSTLTNCISQQPSQPVAFTSHIQLNMITDHSPSPMIEGISQQPFLLENPPRDVQQLHYIPNLGTTNENPAVNSASHQHPSLPRLLANDDDVQNTSTPENITFHQQPSIPFLGTFDNENADPTSFLSNQEASTRPTETPGNDIAMQNSWTPLEGFSQQQSSLPLPQKLQEPNDFLNDGEMNNVLLNGIESSYPQYTLEDFDSFFVDDESNL